MDTGNTGDYHAPWMSFRSLFVSRVGVSHLSILEWLVGCFGFNGPLRQYFSLYRAASQREGEREERIDESKNVQTTPTRTYCKRNRPLPYCNQNCRTPRHWRFTQHHRTTRPSPFNSWSDTLVFTQTAVICINFSYTSAEWIGLFQNDKNDTTQLPNDWFFSSLIQILHHRPYILVQWHSSWRW